MNNLKDINWSQLGYPNMENILNGLSSEDKDIRERAYEGLFDYYLYDIHSVCLYLVPYFIMLLQTPDVLEKDRLMTYLHKWVRNIQSTRGAGIKDKELSLILAEIVKGKDIYLLLKNSNDSDASSAANDLLDALKFEL